ncbi:MAG: hypothetical protein QF554_08700 [Dehalococcoidia bacterium]|jgi:hypothetical protein|nr:hypothetical protein [Dehalococcoidia bacterium]
MRIAITALVAVGGIVLALVSALLLAAPLGGAPFDESFSNPRLVYAPTLAVIGVALVFSAAIVYELMPRIGDD